MPKKKIKKLDYIGELIKNFPNIKSGRKNYKFYYERILKNIKLIKAYKKNNAK